MERRRKAAERLLQAEHEYLAAMRDDRASDTTRSRIAHARAKLEAAELEALLALWERPRPAQVVWFTRDRAAGAGTPARR